MAWFQRDHTGRALRPFERQFVTALSQQLADLRVPQIDERETALTAERDHCLILLIPHRALGGISIVVWLTAEGAAVTWAQVAGLDCCHDSLDLGIWVEQIPFDGEKPDFEPILASIRAQLGAPLVLRRFDQSRASILVHDQKGRLREVGRIGGRIGWLEARRATGVQDTLIRLTDSAPPPVTAPSSADEWFGTQKE